MPLGHGLPSTLFAMRLADRLDIDGETASHTYYVCLFFYVGRTPNYNSLTRSPITRGLDRGQRWSPASCARSHLRRRLPAPPPSSRCELSARGLLCKPRRASSYTFLQHVRSLLTIHGRAAIVVPANAPFDGGAGETVRRRTLEQCDVHALFRLPTGSSTPVV
jgi:N-6 DNA Methylase